MDQTAPEQADSAARTLGYKRHWLPRIFDAKDSLLTPSEGWITVALLLAMNLVVIFTVQDSEWVTPMPRLWLVGSLAMAAGLGLAKIRGPVFFQGLAHVLVLGLGFGVALVETANLLDGSASAKFDELFTRLDVWFSAVGGQGISNDRLPFSFFLAASTWMMMYLAAWFTFKFRWPWLALIPAAFALMTNMTYLPSSRYPVPLSFFLLFAILFMSRMHFLQRTTQWRVQRLTEKTPRRAHVVNALILTSVVLAVAWVVPTQRITVGFLEDGYRTARSPWVELEDDFERVFAGIESKKGSPLHSFGDSLPLRGRVSLGTQEVFLVTTDFPAYWRAQSYDFYEGRGWIANQDQRESFAAEEVAAAYDDAGYRKREVIAQEVRLSSESPIVFAGGQPIEVSVPTEVEIAIPQIFEIDFDRPDENGDLPQDLAEVAAQLLSSRLSLEELSEFIPSETTVVRETEGTLLLTRHSPQVPDVLSVKSAKRLKADSSYQVLSSISVATERELRSAGDVYPKWVTDNYLQLPDGLPDRTRQLALDLTEGLDSPYEKGVAIVDFLRGFEETFNIEAPPLNVDAVDYFLFSIRAGYSDYFASATAVLLRATGVPTRLASGYSTGEWDPESSAFTVRVSDAHSWPEVFFPTYGWIAFEPSPSKAPINRGPLAEVGGAPDTLSDEDIEDILDDILFDEEEFLPDDLLPLTSEPLADFVGSIGIKIGLAIGSLLGAVVTIMLLFAALWQVNFIGLPYGPGMYSRMTKLGALGWRAPHRTETPMEYATALASTAALRSDRTRAIALGFMRSRYGAHQPSSEERDEIERAWRGIRKSLVRRLLRRINPREMLSRGS